MELLSSFGLPARATLAAGDPQAASAAAIEVGFPAVIKAMIPVGGRGKAGFVKIVSSPGEAARVSRDMFGKSLGGHAVREIAVARAFDIEAEFYLCVTIDASYYSPVVIFSPEGGVDIEALAKDRPELVASFPVNLDGNLPFVMSDKLLGFGLDSDTAIQVERFARRLARLFIERDLLLAEINPLALLSDGSVKALDCKLEVDDSALHRYPLYAPPEPDNTVEAGIRKLGCAFVSLSGDIGVICNGAGMGLAIVDMLSDQRLEAANFLDTGGGTTKQRISDVCRVMFRQENIRGLIISIWGGITLLDEVAAGILETIDEVGFNKPLVVKLIGPNHEIAMDMLERAGIAVSRDARTEIAVALLKELLLRESLSRDSLIKRVTIG